MNLDFDIFEEFESNVFQRFSSIILFVYLYYSLSYYFITEDKINKPHIFFILILIILHLIHIICLKILHKNELVTYSWILAMAPLVLYLLYTKYKERVLINQKKKEQQMMQKLRNQMNLPDGQPFMRNANPQMPNKPPQQQFGQQNPNQQSIMPQQQPRPVLPMVNRLDESRNMENLQQNRASRMNLNQQQNPNQLSERIDQPTQLMGMDPYFNGLSNF